MKNFAIFLPLMLATIGCSSPVDEITLSDPSKIENAVAIEVAQGDWPWWRGPTFDGRATGAAPPVRWSSTENVVWQADVPGRGHASPSIWGGQVFVATADEARQTMSLLCYDRQSGDLLWDREVHSGGFMHTHSKNSHASATPACDGAHVYSVFMVQQGIWVTAVDLAGNIAWQKKVGDFTSKNGYGSSPVLYKSLVIVAADNSGGAFLAALHSDSGEIAWKVARESAASFATPVLAEVAGREQLLISGHSQVVSYNPVTGERLWQSEGPADSTANTLAWNDTLVFASGGWPQRGIMAIRADGGGEVAWRSREKVYVPSPLLIDDRLVVVSDEGVALCFDAATGSSLWKERLGGNFSASPVFAGGHVYLPDESGTMHVFKAGVAFETVAENYLAPGGMASPIICDGRIYLRTDSKLFCIGENAAP